MFLENQKSDLQLTFDDHNKAVVKTLLDDFPLADNPLTSDNAVDLTSTYPGHVFLLHIGIVKSELDGLELCCYDEGDLIGIPQCFGMSNANLTNNNSYIEVYPIEFQALKSFIAERSERLDIWHKLLASEIARLEVTIGFLHTTEQRRKFGFRVFKAGEVIIQEGTVADEVYTLVEGKADVITHGIKVGEVRENEIFGVMALLTNTLRSATVIAQQQCLVMIVPNTQFQRLVETRPEICLNLMKNMAHQIISLNNQVHSLSNKPQSP